MKGVFILKSFNFHLPRINRKATKEAVEKELSKLQYTLLTLSESHQPKVTSSLKLVPVKSNGQFHSSTEDTAIKNLEEKEDKIEFINHMLEMINRLSDLERKIIVKEYMGDDYKFNYEIYNELFISKAYYYRLKGRAFYNIALMLKKEVYVYQEKVKA